MDNFGEKFRLASHWFNILSVDNYSNKPINANSYASHEHSKLFCIDPYQDYDDYPEYKNKQDIIYSSFLKNIKPYKNKIHHIRGFSNKEIFKFDDNFFDIIYIDGNHEPEYVLEDAVLSFRKLKHNGILIFDDYGWHNLTQHGIDAFLSTYHKKIEYICEKETQVFIKKL